MAETAVAAPSAGAEVTAGAAAAASPTAEAPQLTDEQILGIDTADPIAGDAQVAQPEAESGAGEQTDETTPNDGATQETTQAQGQQPQKGITPEIREFFKAHPEIRDAYFRSQEYAKLFPDFKTAEMVAAQLAQYDGPEQLVEDLKGVTALNALDRMFYSGDREQHGRIVENLFTDSPQNFAQMIDAFPDTLRRLAGDRANPELAKAAMETLVDANTRFSSDVLTWGHERATARGNEELAKKYEEIAEDLFDRAPWAPESVDDKLAKLQAKEKQLEQQQKESKANAAQQWVDTTNEQVVTEFTGAVKKTVEDLVGGTYSEEAKRLLVGEIYRRVHKALGRDADLVGDVQALMDAGVGDERVQRQIVRLVTTQAKRMIPTVAETVIGAFGNRTLAETKQRETRQAAAAGRVDVTGSAGMDARSVKTVTPDELKRSGKYRELSDDDLLEGRT